MNSSDSCSAARLQTWGKQLPVTVIILPINSKSLTAFQHIKQRSLIANHKFAVCRVCVVDVGLFLRLCKRMDYGMLSTEDTWSVIAKMYAQKGVDTTPSSRHGEKDESVG